MNSTSRGHMDSTTTIGEMDTPTIGEETCSSTQTVSVNVEFDMDINEDPFSIDVNQLIKSDTVDM